MTQNVAKLDQLEEQEQSEQLEEPEQPEQQEQQEQQEQPEQLEELEDEGSKWSWIKSFVNKLTTEFSHELKKKVRVLNIKIVWKKYFEDEWMHTLEFSYFKQQEQLEWQQEQQKLAKEQEIFEKHGKRQIDPTGFKAPARMASPPQVPDSRVGPAKGHEARMAKLMRARDLTSEVPQQEEQKEEPPAKPRATPPRATQRVELDRMANAPPTSSMVASP